MLKFDYLIVKHRTMSTAYRKIANEYSEFFMIMGLVTTFTRRKSLQQ